MRHDHVRCRRILCGTASALMLLSLCSQPLGCRAAPAARTAEQRLGGGVETMRTLVTSSVVDLDRRARMLSIIDEAKVDLERAANQLATLRAQQETLDARYDATPEEFRGVGDRIHSLRATHQATTIELRQKLAANATDAEWKSITARDLGLFSE